MLPLACRPLFLQRRLLELSLRLSLLSCPQRLSDSPSIYLALLLHHLLLLWRTSDNLLRCHAQHLPLPLQLLLHKRLSRLFRERNMTNTTIHHLHPLVDITFLLERLRLRRRLFSPALHLLPPLLIEGPLLRLFLQAVPLVVSLLIFQGLQLETGDLWTCTGHRCRWSQGLLPMT
jgi:hypothetical protein